VRPVFLLFVLFLTACSRQQPETPFTSKSLSPTKQKQRIAVLKKKLESAEKEKDKAQREVELLRHQMESAELALIGRKLSEYEKRLSKLKADPDAYAKFLPQEKSALFLEERKLLHQIIQAGPSPLSIEAQTVLDKILRLITILSSENQT